jgi:hypothetical protein
MIAAKRSIRSGWVRSPRILLSDDIEIVNRISLGDVPGSTGLCACLQVAYEIHKASNLSDERVGSIEFRSLHTRFFNFLSPEDRACKFPSMAGKKVRIRAEKPRGKWKAIRARSKLRCSTCGIERPRFRRGGVRGTHASSLGKVDQGAVLARRVRADD